MSPHSKGVSEEPALDVRLEVETPVTGVEAVSELLWSLSPAGLERVDAETLAPFGADPLRPGCVRLCVYLPPGGADCVADVASYLAARQRSGVAVAPFRVRQTRVPREPWQQRWREFFHPTRVGSRLWVRPPWEEPDSLPADAVCVVIDPGPAFGTGTHETTRLCLQAIELESADRPGLSVLDVGCGAGVLAIAASLLGCNPVVGVDTDPIAVAASRENAVRNGVSGVDFRLGGIEEVTGHFDLVVANLTAAAFGEIGADMSARLAVDGLLVVSGVLVPEAEGVEEVLVAAGEGMVREPGKERELGEWARLCFRKKVAATTVADPGS